jgi:hypothetical protein
MNKYFVLLNMESVCHIVAIRVNETSWAHVWRLRSRYLGMGYDATLEWRYRYMDPVSKGLMMAALVASVIRPTCQRLNLAMGVVMLSTCCYTFLG